MSKKHIQKQIDLSMAFDRYVLRDDSILKGLPRKAMMILTEKGADRFNAQMHDTAQKVRDRGEKVVEMRKEGSRWVLVR